MDAARRAISPWPCSDSRIVTEPRRSSSERESRSHSDTFWECEKRKVTGTVALSRCDTRGRGCRSGARPLVISGCLVQWSPRGRAVSSLSLIKAVRCQVVGDGDAPSPGREPSPRQAASLLEVLAGLTDRRRRRGVRHSLAVCVVAVLVVAVACGAAGPLAAARLEHVGRVRRQPDRFLTNENRSPVGRGCDGDTDGHNGKTHGGRRSHISRGRWKNVPVSSESFAPFRDVSPGRLDRLAGQGRWIHDPVPAWAMRSVTRGASAAGSPGVSIGVVTEPKTVRFRLLHTAGRIVHSQRRRRLRTPPGPGPTPWPPTSPGSRP